MSLVRKITLLILLSTSWANAAAADPIRAGGEHCVVNTRSDDPLNLRVSPNDGARVEARLSYATCGLLVTGACRGKWCPIEDGHFAGWVHRHYIAVVSPATHCLARQAEGELRAWPSRVSRVLTRPSPGTCGLILLPYRVDGWQKTRLGGWEGWVPGAQIATMR